MGAQKQGRDRLRGRFRCPEWRHFSRVTGPEGNVSNSIFPALPGLAWNITRSPRFATKVQQAVGGRVVTTSFQPYPVWSWTLSFEFLRTYKPVVGSQFTEWQRLVGFFEARQGAFDSFLFDDPEDDGVSAQDLGVGDGANKNFQLSRTLGGFNEPIYNLNRIGAITFKVYVNGAVKTEGVDFSISATGLITFVTAPAIGDPVQADFNYYWRVRFATDLVEFNQFAQHFWEARQVRLVSVLGS